MRTMYAIVDVEIANKAGIDLNTHQLLDNGKKVIITQSEASGMEKIELLTRQQVLVYINSKKE